MQSAAELRRYTDNLALEKSVKVVTDALDKEPLGLDISQLTTVCRLSIKTTKKVLAMINAESENGVWYLDKKRKSETEQSLADLKTKPVSMVPAAVKPKPPEEQLTYFQQLICLLQNNPGGITLESALSTLGWQRGRFDPQLSYIRKHYFPVRLETVGEQRLYIPDLDKHHMKTNTTATDTSTNTAQPASTTKQQPVENTTPVAPTTDPIIINQVHAKIDEYRAMVQKKIIVTEEVILSSEQVDSVLKDIFGLDTVTWKTTGEKVQVHLTRTEVA